MQGMSLIDEALRLHGDRALQVLDAYWRGLSAHGGVPHWSDVDPAAIQDALEYAFLADRLGQSHARLRVAGGAVAQLLGGTATGRPLSVFLSPDARPGFDAALGRCFAVGMPLALSLSASRHGVTGRMALYPLSGERGRVSQLLGGLVVSGKPWSVPVRFDQVGGAEGACSGGVGVRGVGRIGALPQTPEFTGKMKGSRRSSLRLVVNNG